MCLASDNGMFRSYITGNKRTILLSEIRNLMECWDHPYRGYETWREQQIANSAPQNIAPSRLPGYPSPHDHEGKEESFEPIAGAVPRVS